MAEKMDLKEIVTLEELIVSNVFTQEALLNVLVKKKIITKKEIMDEIKKLNI